MTDHADNKYLKNKKQGRVSDSKFKTAGEEGVQAKLKRHTRGRGQHTHTTQPTETAQTPSICPLLC